MTFESWFESSISFDLLTDDAIKVDMKLCLAVVAICSPQIIKCGGAHYKLSPMEKDLELRFLRYLMYSILWTVNYKSSLKSQSCTYLSSFLWVLKLFQSKWDWFSSSPGGIGQVSSLLTFIVGSVQFSFNTLPISSMWWWRLQIAHHILVSVSISERLCASTILFSCASSIWCCCERINLTVLICGWHT